ncbi:MAG TPA: NAD(P)/FAD-dependent oxidoreductase [Acidobacteriaceae bacterium]|jgi:kynurenine 3-monooxygenase|nr:NAD(P)/FAD-dependent oxidoreductase [Acidobacteriaceae bacterium]
MKTPTITIIGAGLVGPLLAISLRQRGFPVVLYERREDMRRVFIESGRSINLAVSARGIYALEQAGVWSKVRDIVIPMRGRLMHLLTGELVFQPYGQGENEVINSVSRAALNIALLDAAEAAGVALHFQQRCLGCARADDGIVVRLRDEQSGGETEITADIVFGADGSSSAVREGMSRSPGFRLTQESLNYGYKELTIPAGQGGSHAMERRALHIWPRGSYMLIALPNVDGTYGCILFLPFEGERGFADLDSRPKVVEFFRANFPDALALMPNLAENYFANPTGAMVTVRCFPWHQEGNILLLGDAAHAIVPFFGQGINCGFEDCTCFLELLDAARTSGAESVDWQKLFTDFESSRKPDTEAIADLALENFVEMRDRVADPHFLFRKKVDLALEARLPGLYVPKYAMVTFHRIPYAIAQQRGRIQDRLLDEICAGIDRLEDIDWNKAAMLVHRDLTQLGKQ